MVEMLGVLAIIGVLSAGALAGYSKAMFRYRTNQTIDIFTRVLQRFEEFEKKEWGEVSLGDDGPTDSATDLVKYGFLEKCEVAYGGYGLDKPGCKLPIGILKFDFYDDARYGVLGWFAITFTDSKSCVAFSSVDWIHSIPIEWLRSGGGINIGSIQLNEDEALSITMSDIIQGCKECDEEGACSFRIFINGDI